MSGLHHNADVFRDLQQPLGRGVHNRVIGNLAPAPYEDNTLHTTHIIIYINI